MTFQDLGGGFYRVGAPHRSAFTGRYGIRGASVTDKYDDEDLREWAEGIWAAVEYRGDGVRALKRVLEEIEARS